MVTKEISWILSCSVNVAIGLYGRRTVDVNAVIVHNKSVG